MSVGEKVISNIQAVALRAGTLTLDGLQFAATVEHAQLKKGNKSDNSKYDLACLFFVRGSV